MSTERFGHESAQEGELIERLRAARLKDSEIAPLDAARSARIRAHAIASARRRGGGTPRGSWLFPVWRPMLAAAFTLLIGATIVWRPGTPTVQIAHTVPESVARPIQLLPISTTLVADNSAPKPERHTEKVSTQRRSTIPETSHRRAARRERPITRRIPPALISPRNDGDAEWAGSQVKQPSATALSSTHPIPEEKDPDGPMVVAATGVPDDDTGELHVSVRHDVGADVPGTAEVSGIRSFPGEQGKVEPAEYWTNARDASDTQPTLTLTALR